MKKKPKISIDSRLDLHGYTVQKAFEALVAFVEQSNQMRCVLVITGKSGVLRQELPKWLTQNPIFSTIRDYQSDSTGGAYLLFFKK